MRKRAQRLRPKENILSEGVGERNLGDTMTEIVVIDEVSAAATQDDVSLLDSP
jgi:hypothetical protein